MTYAQAMEEAEAFLEKAGITDARVDARLLLSYFTGKDRTFLLTHGDEELKDGIYPELKRAVEERAGHKPVQLITGNQEFMGFEFEVDREVLIPRLDTEFLTEEALKDITDGSSVLDLCCGSGCIIISLCRLTNDLRAYASDISDAALELGRRNAERLGAEVTFIKSDMFGQIEGSFDFIISNPPYIRRGDIAGLMEEVRDHEPVTALDGGEDGLDFYRTIAAGASEHLQGGGGLLMEIGYDQGESVKEIFEAAGYKNVEVLRDLSGNERVVKCLKSWTT